MRVDINVIFLLFLTFISCQVIEPTINNEDEVYPTTISPLSDTEYGEAIIEYKNINNFLICTSLNEYGYCEYDLALCLNRPILREEIDKSESELINLAKAIIYKNKKFTGVDDLDELSVRRSIGITGCIKCDGSDEDLKCIQWRIDFNNQKYKGYEVFDTGIIVFLDNDSVFMLGGNWYSNIVIPSTNIYSLEKVKDILVGQKRTIHCWTDYEIEITNNNFPAEARKVVIPYANGYEVELRVVWEIIISDSAYVFCVDVVTGEIILERQLIIC